MNKKENKAWIYDYKTFKVKFGGNISQDLLNHLKEFPVSKEHNLDTSYENVMYLLDFMELINNNSNQLKNPRLKIIIEKGVMPSALLLDYIILEISSFYTNINQMKKEGKSFPKIPEYWDVLKDYRNLGPGHRDKNHELKTLKDHVLSVKKLDLIGVPKIVEDFMKYYAQIKKTKKK